MSKEKVAGLDFSKDIDLKSLLDSYKNMGNQAAEVYKASQLLKKVLALRSETDPKKRPFVFLGYSSNMISCGLREVICYMAKHKLIDAIVTAGGGVEEDFMKCFRDSYVIDYVVDDKAMRLEGKNRIGNMLVPNDTYVVFENWLTPILESLSTRQDKEGTITTPSEIVLKMGEKIDNEDSVYHWCFKNEIPVFCPGISDGAVGDIIYFKSFKESSFIIDTNQDLTRIMDLGACGRPLAGVVIGGGMAKYHVLNAAKMGGGLDYGIFVSCAVNYDASSSGATPDEEKSRKTIKPEAEVSFVQGEASIIFSLIAAVAFAKDE